MLYKLFSTAILAILVLGQGAVSVPQARAVTCGGSDDPPGPTGKFCCVPLIVPARPGHCATICPL
ncbi:hypothetical protein DFH09DRAFT_1367014 [Mycena vulgaris]|nr:hypothetical protein DFH09DRAFT_1367014 [Mycena vulgaris]